MAGLYLGGGRVAEAKAMNRLTLAARALLESVRGHQPIEDVIHRAKTREGAGNHQRGDAAAGIKPAHVMGSTDDNRGEQHQANDTVVNSGFECHR